MSYMVKEVADIIGVSIRTMHHYDKIGLLKPESISPSGYRLYAESDLEKLQQILFFKELDFSLEEIKEILSSPSFDRKEALKSHKILLEEKRIRLEKIIKSVDNTIASIEGGITMNKNDMFDSFDMTEIEKHKEKYSEEIKQKYGNTNAYKESQLKTSKYTKEDWAKIMAKQENIYKNLAGLMEKEPSDPQVQKLISENRQFITDNFYNCTVDIFRGLGELYVNDERFTKNIDKVKSGLAKFLNEGIQIYCDNNMFTDK